MKDKGLIVVEYFGGTYESAKDDEREEFQKMLSFVKKKKSIGYIIVYSYDRFSRSGPSGAFISFDLKQRGIKVVSTTQSVDHSDPSGFFMEGIYHLFSQLDNQLRRDKSMTGMIEKLKQGYWPYIPPTGYTNKHQGKTADQHEFYINEQGQLLKKAFELKANEDLRLTDIANRLNARGWDIPAKRLSHYFKNPFYCGVIASRLVPNELIKGKHPPLISQSTFIKVQQNLEKFHSGYVIEKEVEALPLKQFVKCDCCETTCTGYLAKKKGLYYYKCNRNGCSNNRSQKVMHQKFEELLKSISLNNAINPIIKKMFLHLLSQQTEKDEKKNIKLEMAAIKSKLENLEEKYINGEIDQELYLKFRDKYLTKIMQFEKEIEGKQNYLSNLENAVEKCLKLALNLPLLWKKSNYVRKRRIQNLVFPEGIFYNRKKDDYRTGRINLLFSAIPCLVGLTEDNKNGEIDFFTIFPTWVGPPGLEPGTP